MAKQIFVGSTTKLHRNIFSNLFLTNFIYETLYYFKSLVNLDFFTIFYLFLFRLRTKVLLSFTINIHYEPLGT